MVLGLSFAMSYKPHLIMVVGPTGIGKTHLALQLASCLQCPIVSADSRQIYREMPIGTAAPTQSEQSLVKHYMVGVASIREPFSIAHYEEKTIPLLETLFTKYSSVVMCGGSMLYLDVIEKGIDAIPSIDPKVRDLIQSRLQNEGAERLREELKLVDPFYYEDVDLANTKRIIHALEVYYTTGKPYSFFRKGYTASRPFHIYKVYIELPREQLYERINLRTEKMLRSGWLKEALSLYPYRSFNALNTIGYKELFSFFESATKKLQGRKDGEPISIEDVDEAIAPMVEILECNPLSLKDSFLREEYLATVAKIQAATRQYARQQTIRFRQDSRAIRVSSTIETTALLPLLIGRGKR